MRFPAAKLRKGKHINPINPGNVDLMSLIPNAPSAQCPQCPMPPMPNAQCPMPPLVSHPKLLLPPSWLTVGTRSLTGKPVQPVRKAQHNIAGEPVGAGIHNTVSRN